MLFFQNTCHRKCIMIVNIILLKRHFFLYLSKKSCLLLLMKYLKLTKTSSLKTKNSQIFYSEQNLNSSSLLPLKQNSAYFQFIGFNSTEYLSKFHIHRNQFNIFRKTGHKNIFKVHMFTNGLQKPSHMMLMYITNLQFYFHKYTSSTTSFEKRYLLVTNVLWKLTASKITLTPYIYININIFQNKV